MDIPDEIAAFLDSATLAVAVTRDRNRVPHAYRAPAFGISPGKKALVAS